MAQTSKNTWWITLGCGCVALVLFGIVAVGGLGWLGVSKVQGYVADLEDPVRRSERAREILGAEALPEGYNGAFFVEIPWVVTLAALSDDPRLAEQLEEVEELSISEPGRHFFFYTLYKVGDGHEEPRASRGRPRTGDGQVNLQIEDLDLVSDQLLDEGSFELGRQQIEYEAHVGAHIDDLGQRQPGIDSQMKIGCPDGKHRVAVWFERRDPPAEEADVPEISVGSPAERTALETFMGHFDLCGG